MKTWTQILHQLTESLSHSKTHMSLIRQVFIDSRIQKTEIFISIPIWNHSSAIGGSHVSISQVSEYLSNWLLLCQIVNGKFSLTGSRKIMRPLLRSSLKKTNLLLKLMQHFILLLIRHPLVRIFTEWMQVHFNMWKTIKNIEYQLPLELDNLNSSLSTLVISSEFLRHQLTSMKISSEPNFPGINMIIFLFLNLESVAWKMSVW